jgi:hypothetical protein
MSRGGMNECLVGEGFVLLLIEFLFRVGGFPRGFVGNLFDLMLGGGFELRAVGERIVVDQGLVAADGRFDTGVDGVGVIQGILIVIHGFLLSGEMRGRGGEFAWGRSGSELHGVEGVAAPSPFAGRFGVEIQLGYAKLHPF